MLSNELQDDEIPKTVNLSPAEIAAREEEKAALSGFARSRLKSDRGRIRGEGSSLDAEPNIRERLAAERRERGESEPVHSEQQLQPAPRPAGGPRAKLTLDPAQLAALAATAQQLEAEAEVARVMYEAAAGAASEARSKLDTYVREHGLVA